MFHDLLIFHGPGRLQCTFSDAGRGLGLDKLPMPAMTVGILSDSADQLSLCEQAVSGRTIRENG